MILRFSHNRNLSNVISFVPGKYENISNLFWAIGYVNDTVHNAWSGNYDLCSNNVSCAMSWTIHRG